MLRITLAVLHLLALGIGFGAIINRSLALRSSPTPGSVRRLFQADTAWGIAAALWVTTGIWRWVASTEKDSDYYLNNHFFLAKMGVLVLIILFEIWPMITLIGWRTRIAKGSAPESVASPVTASRIARISNVQAVLTALMVVLAVLMARGFGLNS